MGFDTKILWITDLHLTDDGSVEGKRREDRLERLVEHLNQWHGDAACCIATGDLTNNGTGTEYATLRGIVGNLKMPFLPMIGNHDNRETLISTFPPPGSALTGFHQYRWDAGEAVLLCLDTQDPGQDSGIFCQDRLAWLERELTALQGRRVLVFMHHPPGPLGLGPVDALALCNADPLMDLLGASAQVAHLFCGHVHQTVCGTVAGVPFSTLRAATHPTDPHYLDPDVTFQQAPQFAVILSADDRIAVHSHDLPEVI